MGPPGKPLAPPDLAMGTPGRGTQEQGDPEPWSGRTRDRSIYLAGGAAPQNWGSKITPSINIGTAFSGWDLFFIPSITIGTSFPM